jgi:membrane-bound serine protease (ClpP class)
MGNRRFCLLLLTLFAVPLIGLFAQESPIVEAAPSEPETLPSEPKTVSAESESAKSEATASEPETASSVPEVALSTDAKISVYVVPITDAINKPNKFILRRALKDAIENQVDMVILDMDTPGGRVDFTIEMMEMLTKFDGITATYVNDDAISAGSFIAAATQEIYFAPQGKIGASAVIQGGGEDVPETARLKIESYLRANIRVMTEDYPFRSDVIRAMLDADFELKIGEDVIKAAGELLTLTASEAMKEYGDPPHPLLGKGIYESMDELLDARFGAGQYEIRDFKLTYSEEIAKWMSTFAPALMGIGMLLLFLEFKTPGFGIFGIGGIAMIAIFFASQYVAGLAGNEPIIFFVLGVVLVMVELFFFPGTFVLALSGLGLMLGSLLWAMVDFWPDEPLHLNPQILVEPLVNLIFGLGIAVFGALLFGRFFQGSFFERRLVLADVAGGQAGVIREERAASLPRPGAVGEAITDLFPSGRVEIKGLRYDARSALGSIDSGARIVVVKSSDFSLVVKEAAE